MVGFCRSKFHASCAIRILACLTIVLLLNITTVHCNTSSQNNSRTDSATVSLNTNVNANATHSENRGKIIMLILYNRRLKRVC